MTHHFLGLFRCSFGKARSFLVHHSLFLSRSSSAGKKRVFVYLFPLGVSGFLLSCGI